MLRLIAFGWVRVSQLALQSGELLAFSQRPPKKTMRSWALVEVLYYTKVTLNCKTPQNTKREVRQENKDPFKAPRWILASACSGFLNDITWIWQDSSQEYRLSVMAFTVRGCAQTYTEIQFSL